MMRLIVPTLIGFLVPASALACSCITYRDAQSHIDETDVIFDGIAMDTRKAAWSKHARKTRFRVKHVWKGKLRDIAVIGHHDNAMDSCGVRFNPGEEYRILAVRVEARGLITGHCGFLRFDWSEYESILTDKEEGSPQHPYTK